MSESQFVIVTHPDITAPGVVARSALAHLGDGWVVEGDAPSPFGAGPEPAEAARKTKTSKSAT